MAFEAINLFSHKIDPRGIVDVLRQSGFKLEISGPEDDWTDIVVEVKKGGLFSKRRVLTFAHDSEYYSGEGWAVQVSGMQGYFSRFAEVPRMAEIMRMIGSFRFVLAVPQEDLDIWSDDERIPLLYSVCQKIDGVIFTPYGLLDSQGRTLIEEGGLFDEEATLPFIPSMEPSSESDEEEYDDEPIPPTPLRVARRALALTAVAARATLEMDAPQLDEPDELRRRLLDWVETLEIGDEFEPDEWKVLQRSVGNLESQDHINALWRVEGLTVLAWALGRFELPPDDELVMPSELYPAMGFLDPELGRAVLEGAELRSAEELEELQTHLLMLHWRVRDYSIRPGPMDFVAFSKSSWIGEFDVSKFRLIENDLAIGGAAIDDADPEHRSIVQSLAHERHLAINWLMGYSEKYSDTDTST
ncbi:DUF4272 domain-containing protein [Blastopirellula sp. JC732]|uniref:DUF4272 domain-containing protein n=1 Tax=Blastopirellula sediminis TaxID=2894196 RepID=A0A9X1MJU4_9BACT|nr:DUF4272 domain-containing protein [Blastopirellula sediminis]MCC9604289.1 DUF4272 domain-containing protein [Blastopirellula sediminis]MCC9626809.1 DUF4272 domain-containing protein [Blastopirellula sediminis]